MFASTELYVANAQHLEIQSESVFSLSFWSTDLVAEDGSVGGNPKPLTWKTESSYQPEGWKETSATPLWIYFHCPDALVK